ncbi:MAG: ceramidase domain-containing protein [Deltaproteobacteria bacterium]|nr:ceramidase domain-containing protein [Deltaproteobacteria bacterium]
MNELLTSSIPLYCERSTGVVGSSSRLLAEPLNLASNLSFVVAAIFVWRAIGRRIQAPHHGVPRCLKGLLSLIVATGIGSALWHSFATQWAMALDVAPIAAFVLLFLGVMLRALGASAKSLLGAYALLIGLAALTTFTIPASFASGSRSYVAPLLALFALTTYLSVVAHPSAKSMRVATASFVFALVGRSLDQSICSILPMGTHFVWHLMNGVVLYCATLAAAIAVGLSRFPNRSDTDTSHATSDTHR